MDHDAQELRRRVARLKRDRPGFRFSAPLRGEITAWVAAKRQRGAWWCDLSRDLGISTETLKRWAEPRTSTIEPSMLPVDVIDAPPVGTVTLVASSGLRIEGVSIEAAIAILRSIA
jgi:hypothetical protein